MRDTEREYVQKMQYYTVNCLKMTLKLCQKITKENGKHVSKETASSSPPLSSHMRYKMTLGLLPGAFWTENYCQKILLIPISFILWSSFSHRVNKNRCENAQANSQTY